MTTKSIKGSVIFAIFLLVFCIQTPDIKIGFVKISEIILLLLTPLIYKKSMNKYFFYFFIFFSIEMVLSLVITYFTHFEILGPSKIKSPYIITVARYIELFTCISLGLFTFNFIKNNRNQSSRIINFLVNSNVIITLIFVFIYIFVVLRIVPISKSIIVYENYRLRGFYNEGGPYGLMLSFVFMLTFFQKKTLLRTVKQIFLFLVIALCAKSKAGMLFVILWIGFLNIVYIKNKLREFVYPIVVIFLVSFYFIFVNLSWTYFKEFNRITKAVVERPTDRNLILGRVSGTYIVPVMIKNNPVFGIGLGNYPLVRNNVIYRQFFPKPPRKIIDIDSHGYGGIIDIIVEMGIVGLLIYSYIMRKLYIDLKRVKKGGIVLLGLLMIYAFGVQLVFLYPWVLLGIIIAYKNRFIDEVSN